MVLGVLGVTGLIPQLDYLSPTSYIFYLLIQIFLIGAPGTTCFQIVVCGQICIDQILLDNGL